MEFKDIIYLELCDKILCCRGFEKKIIMYIASNKYYCTPLAQSMLNYWPSSSEMTAVLLRRALFGWDPPSALALIPCYNFKLQNSSFLLSVSSSFPFLSLSLFAFVSFLATRLTSWYQILSHSHSNLGQVDDTKLTNGTATKRVGLSRTQTYDVSKLEVEDRSELRGEVHMVWNLNWGTIAGKLTHGQPVVSSCTAHVFDLLT